MSMMVMDSQRSLLRGDSGSPNRGALVKKYGISAHFKRVHGDDGKWRGYYNVTLPFSIVSPGTVYDLAVYIERGGYPLIASDLYFPSEKYREVRTVTGRIGFIQERFNVDESAMRRIFVARNAEGMEKTGSVQMTVHDSDVMSSWVSFMSNSEKKYTEMIGTMESKSALRFLDYILNTSNLSRMLKDVWAADRVNGLEAERRLTEIAPK